MNISVRVQVVVWQPGQPLPGRGSKFRAEIFLYRPKPGEPFAPRLHVPEVELRILDAGADGSLKAAFAQIEAKLAPARFDGPPHHVGMIFLPHPTFGAVLSLVHIGTIEGEPARGVFYPYDALPKNLVQSHRNAVIPMALEQILP